MDLNQFLTQTLSQTKFALPFFSWLIFWKGLALWKAARKNQISWFIILLTINSLSLLEIGYFFYFNRWDLGSKKILLFLNKKLFWHNKGALIKPKRLGKER